jgi:hypothetical protein
MTYSEYIRRNMEINKHIYASCPIGQYTQPTSSTNLMNCENCINATPTHNIAFWTNIIMILLIFDVFGINIYTNTRQPKKVMYYSFFVLMMLSMMSYSIMDCKYPMSMLMIKNYMVLSWAVFIPYVVWCINIKFTNHGIRV